MPTPAEIADGRGVLVRLRGCGVDGTDREINASDYGATPDGYRAEASAPDVSGRHR
jgi:hypothetical protein